MTTQQIKDNPIIKGLITALEEAAIKAGKQIDINALLDNAINAHVNEKDEAIVEAISHLLLAQIDDYLDKHESRCFLTRFFKELLNKKPDEEVPAT